MTLFHLAFRVLTLAPKTKHTAQRAVTNRKVSNAQAPSSRDATYFTFSTYSHRNCIEYAIAACILYGYPKHNVNDILDTLVCKCKHGKEEQTQHAYQAIPQQQRTAHFQSTFILEASGPCSMCCGIHLPFGRPSLSARKERSIKTEHLQLLHIYGIQIISMHFQR